MVQKDLVDPESTSVTLAASNLVNDHQETRSEEKFPECQNIASSNKDLDDGRLAAWATVVSAFLLQMTGLGYASAFGVFQDFYVREYLTTNTSSQISWIGSVQTFLMMITSVFAGRMFDKGFCYYLVIAGSVVQIICLFALSLAQPEHYYQVFLAQGLGVGIGSGLSYTPSIVVVAQHFRDPSAIARAMGITVAGNSIGGIVHPILLNSLLHSGKGTGLDGIRRAFKRGTQASAGLVAGLRIIAILLLRTKYPRNDVAVSHDRKETTVKEKSTDFKTMVKKFATDWPYVCFVTGMTLFEIVLYFPLFYLQLYSIQHGLDPGFAFYSVSIVNGASFIGRVVPGFFTRSLGVSNMLLASTSGAVVLIFCMLAVHTVAGVAIFAVLYGFFFGAFISMVNPVLVLLAENHSEIGTRMGICFAIAGFGSLTGTPIAGALLTPKFIWWRPIIFSGCVCLCGVLLFSGCRVLLGKRKGGPWVT